MNAATATAAKFALSAIAITIVAVNVDLAATWRQIIGLSPWLLALALGLIALQSIIGGLRWHAVLCGLGSAAPAGRVVRYFYISVFFNACLSGVLGGDVARGWLAKRAGASLKTVVNSVILDHVAAVAAVAVLVLLTCPLFAYRVGYGAAFVPTAVALGIVAAVLVGAHLDRLPLGYLPTVARESRLLHGVAALGTATRHIFFHPRPAGAVMSLAVIAQTALALAAYVIALGLDMPVTLLECLVLMQPVALITALPISIGGWGLREAATVGLFGLIGVPASAALALSVQLGLLSLVAALPGGLLLLLESGRGEDVSAGVARQV